PHLRDKTHSPLSCVCSVDTQRGARSENDAARHTVKTITCTIYAWVCVYVGRAQKQKASLFHRRGSCIIQKNFNLLLGKFSINFRGCGVANVLLFTRFFFSNMYDKTAVNKKKKKILCKIFVLLILKNIKIFFLKITIEIPTKITFHFFFFASQ